MSRIQRCFTSTRWLFVLAAIALAAMLVSSGRATLAAPDVASGDWPQLGRDAQRTNYSPQQIDPPYCYAWKWYETPIASRAQPVIAGGRLFIGSMDGVMYARHASTGAPLWSFNAGSPIRHSAGVLASTLVFSTHGVYTYALDTATGALKWKTATGSISTAPLIDEARSRAVVASSDGKLTALNMSNGAIVWQRDSGAPILTSPSLSVDGQTIFFGNEAIEAIAVRASDGVILWYTSLQGQSLADRYPVVSGDSVIYRSQPLYFFHTLLYEGDQTMDQAGSLSTNWATDWGKVKPRILSYLTANPAKQTFFVLNASNGASRGIAPVLYTYGNNDIPNVPVVRSGSVYVTYRARHGIQTDGGAVHVSSKYDAELGSMNLSTLDIAGLQSSGAAYNSQFRMTSDEPAMLTMGGNILWVDNWERLGGINVSTGQLIHVGAVSNDWPECNVQCGPGTNNPFFPMSGSGPAYPFPSPRVTEGHQRGGAVIANNMLYWRVIDGGLAGIAHRSGSTCPAPIVYTGEPAASASSPSNEDGAAATRPLQDYVTLDLTTPVANPSAELVDRLRQEVRDLISTDEHLMPFYLERGFSTLAVWPYDTNHPPGPPLVGYNSHGNVYWHDPGELLYTMAMAYPYLDAALQNDVRQYMAREMALYPPLSRLPYGDSKRDWLRQGAARERYAVPMRAQLNNWPPVDTSMSALYGLWLWSKNTGDWSYAQAHWSDATALFTARRTNMADYYSDISGAIGYARMAAHFGYISNYNDGLNAAVGAMQTGRNLTAFIDYARNQYLDPRNQPTGWYLPIFFGLTPEVGLYLREQTNGLAQSHILSREAGDGLRWWYLTRAGAHAEVGETSYVAPIAAWSHFLAHAYILGDKRETLTTWLDRPWGRGDLYSIQKIAATIQATPTQPDLSPSFKIASSPLPSTGQQVIFRIVLRNQGPTFTDTIHLTDTLPIGLEYVPGSLSATSGASDDYLAPMLLWTGNMSGTSAITLTYATLVTEIDARLIDNAATINAGSAGLLVRHGYIVANGHPAYLPVLHRK